MWSADWLAVKENKGAEVTSLNPHGEGLKILDTAPLPGKKGQAECLEHLGRPFLRVDDRDAILLFCLGPMDQHGPMAQISPRKLMKRDV